LIFKKRVVETKIFWKEVMIENTEPSFAVAKLGSLTEDIFLKYFLWGKKLFYNQK